MRLEGVLLLCKENVYMIDHYFRRSDGIFLLFALDSFF